MKTILYPEKKSWEALCSRPVLEKSDLEATVRSILDTVKQDKDISLAYYSGKFDGIEIENLKVTPDEIKQASDLVPDELKKAIGVARTNLQKFHLAQVHEESSVETSKGVVCQRKSVGIEKVGLYIPGGSAPLFSTVLMLGIPAKLAGCSEIILCTPPGKDGRVNPVILYTADCLGLTQIFKTGGAQAIAAMAYGTESIPKVYKIFGPGNQYVTKAKELIQQDGIAIDMPAGPSEVLVVADRFANPEFIAADLISQAEHGADSQVVLLTDYRELTGKVKTEIENQLQGLPRKEIALKALEHSMSVVLPSLEECMIFSNIYAPEHLIINARNCYELADKVINAGSVFLGSFSCESAGDYASGTNHTLPTNGFARNFSGVSVESFQKKISFQELSADGIRELGPVIEIMAEAENLHGHKNAVSVRLKSLKNG
ncbi:MAG: histidinol dehydrogenase [Bacteroidetes bacterium GWF2_41_9]|nr:MAG: histidinol dehydrogenase [Bacteroidetes bacterium GWF2_41_9]